MGLLTSSGAMMLEEYISEPVMISVRVFAIIFMLVGVYRTMRRQAEA